MLMSFSKFNMKSSSILLLPLLVLISCTNQQSYWNEKDNTFVIPSHKLSLHLPYNENWIIAPPSDLPNNILFFGVIPEDGLGLYLFSDDDIKCESVNELSESEIIQQIYPIFEQSTNSDKTDYGTLESEKCKFLNLDAIKFNTIIKIENLGVKFTGYIFVHNDCMLKYVLSMPYPCDEKSIKSSMDILSNSIRIL